MIKALGVMLGAFLFGEKPRWPAPIGLPECIRGIWCGVAQCDEWSGECGLEACWCQLTIDPENEFRVTVPTSDEPTRPILG
jgi:hypothetical protein